MTTSLPPDRPAPRAEEPLTGEPVADTDFVRELASLLNMHSAENASNTPDFILAQYLAGCLDAWNMGMQQRETWYGRDARPSEPQAPPPGGPTTDG